MPLVAGTYSQATSDTTPLRGSRQHRVIVDGVRRTLRECEIHHSQHRSHSSPNAAAPLKSYRYRSTWTGPRTRQTCVDGMINECRSIA